MSHPFVITESVVFAGDFAGIRIQDYDRPFCLTCDMNVRVIK